MREQEMKKIAAAAVSAGLLLGATAAHAQEVREQEFSLTTGVDYSSGDYGTGTDTDILVVPLAARLRTGDLRFTASIPYIHIDGANIVGGDGGPIIVDPDSPRVSRSGIGDLTLGMNYGVPEQELGFGLDFGARVKLPTAESGLGTGETDYSFSTELSKTFGTVTPFVSAGYRVLGDPEGVELNNAFFGSAGASVLMGRSVVLASYDYREATSALTEESQEIFGAFSTPMSETLNFTLYGSAGLSNGAPDYGVGAMLTVRAF
jgi:opacity protein-like surface antigen